MRSRLTVLAIVLCTACIHINTDKLQFGDPEVAMVMRVANLSEVREGQIAREKAAEPSVRDFATMMVNEHTAANNKAEAELFKAEIGSADTELSRRLDAESGTAAENVRTLSGRAFDRAYMQRQITAHESLLHVIDTQLVPHAKKKVVKEQLTALRTAVETHLTRARQVAQSIPAD